MGLFYNKAKRVVFRLNNNNSNSYVLANIVMPYIWNRHTLQILYHIEKPTSIINKESHPSRFKYCKMTICLFSWKRQLNLISLIRLFCIIAYYLVMRYQQYPFINAFNPLKTIRW